MMRKISTMRRCATVLGALILAVAGLAGQAPAPVIVAYLTSGGELIPVARYDGTRWLNTWPEPISIDDPLPVRTVSEIPAAWLGRRVPLKWTAWLQLAQQQQSIAVTGVGRDGACVQSITVTTTLKPQPASDGLAFDRPLPVDAMVRFEPDAPEVSRLRR